MRQKRDKPKSARELLKLEVAEELGLLDKINSSGWGSLNAIETGRIGGILAARLKNRITSD